MGACFYRLRCEVFQNLFLSPMNTGFVRPAVATVPTVYGIETVNFDTFFNSFEIVATVPTVYGIETSCWITNDPNFLRVATVPTVYGIETQKSRRSFGTTNLLQQYLPFTVLKPPEVGCKFVNTSSVATVPTVYGIETCRGGEYHEKS